VRRIGENEDTAIDVAGVSLVRPVCGLENHIEQTLRSGFDLDYPRYEIIFCAAAPNDAVVPLVKRLITEHPHIPARLLVGNERISDNPKLNNVCKGWRAAAYDWVVMADSNVLMPPDYIERLFAAWQPDCGLVSSPPVAGRPDGFWAELECAFLNTYQVRWQYAAAGIGIGFAQGKSMLCRRSQIEKAGGITRLATEPAEDAATTKLIRALGCACVWSMPRSSSPWVIAPRARCGRASCAGRGYVTPRSSAITRWSSCPAGSSRWARRPMCWRPRGCPWAASLRSRRCGTAPKPPSPMRRDGI
jgi:cellulose synthase/poly-beta-1,6-N-acetylglucosamine synthase-like glycosyltransferase